MSERSKKICKVSLSVFSGLLFAFAIFMMIFTIVMVATVDKADRTFLGRRFYIVQSDSMSMSENNKEMDVHFKAGDIIFSKSVKDVTAIEKGSIISFISTNSDSYGQTLTHMVREAKTNSEGTLIGYVTFGTNTGANDAELVTPDRILGQYAGKLSGVGSFFAFVKTTPGYLLCILSPFVLLILYNAVNIFRNAKAYKAEQKAKNDAERADIDAKLKENEEMLRKLEALKQELEEKNGGAPLDIPSEKDSE